MKDSCHGLCYMSSIGCEGARSHLRAKRVCANSLQPDAEVPQSAFRPPATCCCCCCHPGHHEGCWAQAPSLHLDGCDPPWKLRGGPAAEGRCPPHASSATRPWQAGLATAARPQGVTSPCLRAGDCHQRRALSRRTTPHGEPTAPQPRSIWPSVCAWTDDVRIELEQAVPRMLPVWHFRGTPSAASQAWATARLEGRCRDSKVIHSVLVVLAIGNVRKLRPETPSSEMRGYRSMSAVA